MKTSIFDISFTLPPMIEMVQAEKEMPVCSATTMCGSWGKGDC